MLSWRLINSGPADAAFNMALDESIAQSVRSSTQPPTLRIYGWIRQSVSIGAFQKISDISIEYCRAKKIPIVRRPTGGRAILHGDELTYSFSALTEGPFSQNLLSTYKIIGKAFFLAFQYCGLNVQMRSTRNSGENLTKNPACFSASSLGEICIDQIKIIGSAQKRWPGAFLQQGSMPLSIDQDIAGNVFACGSDCCSALHGLKEWLPNLDKDTLTENILRGFREVFKADLMPDHPSDLELETADHLARSKYLSDEHIFRTSRP